MFSVVVIPAGRLTLNPPLLPGSEASAVLAMVNTLFAGRLLSSSAMLTVALPLPVKVKLLLVPPFNVSITVSVLSMIWSLLTITGMLMLF
ncbi:hypothetical protein D3C87_1759220 [compost metagenome]